MDIYSSINSVEYSNKDVYKAKEEMLNDVIEWLEDNLYDYLKINRDFNEADYDSRLFDDLKKAMEE